MLTLGSRALPDAEARSFFNDYVKRNHVEHNVQVRYTDKLLSRGRLSSYRYINTQTSDKKHTFWVSTRGGLVQSFAESEILPFCAHEIGTHLLRKVNDELQPWWGHDRAKFGLTATARETVATEEGLATLNTTLHFPAGAGRLLHRSALLYYAGAMARELNFVDLFDHLARYEPDDARRDSAEDFFSIENVPALHSHCHMGWILIPAHCFAIS